MKTAAPTAILKNFPLAGTKNHQTYKEQYQRILELNRQNIRFKLSQTSFRSLLSLHQEFLNSSAVGGHWQHKIVEVIPPTVSSTYEKGDKKYFANQLNVENHFIGPKVSLKTLRFPWSSFTGVICEKNSFQDSVLHNSVFFCANLEETCFDGCDLSAADFTGSNLRGTSFRGAKLSGTDFEHCDLTGADFSGANVSEARFPGAILLDIVFDPRLNYVSQGRPETMGDGLSSELWANDRFFKKLTIPLGQSFGSPKFAMPKDSLLFPMKEEIFATGALALQVGSTSKKAVPKGSSHVWFNDAIVAVDRPKCQSCALEMACVLTLDGPFLKAFSGTSKALGIFCCQSCKPNSFSDYADVKGQTAFLWLSAKQRGEEEKQGVILKPFWDLPSHSAMRAAADIEPDFDNQSTRLFSIFEEDGPELEEYLKVVDLQTPSVKEGMGQIGGFANWSDPEASPAGCKCKRPLRHIASLDPPSFDAKIRLYACSNSPQNVRIFLDRL